MKYLLFLLLLLTQPLTACEEARTIEISEFCTFFPGEGTWFKFSTPTVTTVSIITAGYADGKMELYEGPCNDLSFLAFDDNSGPFLMPQLQWTTIPEVEYYVHVFDVDLFEICIFNCDPLPVKLTAFTVERDGTLVTLRWSTASETNNNYFTIFRSTDLKSWTEVGRVIGAGNSSTMRYYTYRTIHEDRSKVYYYKLVQTDFNGDFEQLSVIPLVQGVKSKKLIKELTIDGQPVPENFIGLKFLIYDDGTIEKHLVTE